MAECDDRVLVAWIKNDKMVEWKIVHADILLDQIGSGVAQRVPRA